MKLAAKLQPRIAALVGDLATEYFVVCEQTVFCKVPNLKMALFIMFSCYSCFNPEAAKWIFFYFRAARPHQKSATYLK